MEKPDKKVFVTQPSLPPLNEFTKMLSEIWDSKWLTNNGRYHQPFESALSEYLEVKHCSLVTNGTLGLIVGLQALGIEGEVITTPYSFVATSHALLWNKIKPVFCDIIPGEFNLDPSHLETLISEKTSAILAVHVYGYPCLMDQIQKIADRFHLKVIYDAAHAFGVRPRDHSLFDYGDLSILSFHATKAFNTFEGGAVVTGDSELKMKIDYLKNFGIKDEVTVIGPVINAKMSEFQAALGLLQLREVETERVKREQIASLYRKLLVGCRGIIPFLDWPGVRHNYQYFPVLVKGTSGKSRDGLYENLKSVGIYTRRYFYPLISDFPIYRSLGSANSDSFPVARNLSKEVLCLPIYAQLSQEKVTWICEAIREYFK